jgi:hypothetical protein
MLNGEVASSSIILLFVMLNGEVANFTNFQNFIYNLLNSE